MAFNTEIIEGKFILLSIDDKPIAYAQSGSLSISQNTKQVKYKQTDRSSATWKQVIATNKEWTIEQTQYMSASVASGETGYMDTLDVILGTSGATNSVEVKFEYEDSAGNSFTLGGTAIITSHNSDMGEVDGEATYTLSLEGNGELLKTETPIA